MFDRIPELGEVRVKDQEVGVVELEVALPEKGLAPALARTLKAAARGDLRVWRRGW
jgi:hypothetical protein